MDGGMSIGSMVNICAWGLGLGSLFFVGFGVNASKDFFLVLGNLCCIVGDVGFAWFLSDQDELTSSRMVTFYYLAALACAYALLRQLNLYRLEGLGDEDEDAEDEAAAAAAATAALADDPAAVEARAKAAKAAAEKEAAAKEAEEAAAAARRAALEARIASYAQEVQGADVFSLVSRGVLGGSGAAAVPSAGTSSSAGQGASGVKKRR